MKPGEVTRVLQPKHLPSLLQISSNEIMKILHGFMDLSLNTLTPRRLSHPPVLHLAMA